MVVKSRWGGGGGGQFEAASSDEEFGICQSSAHLESVITTVSVSTLTLKTHLNRVHILQASPEENFNGQPAI